jgi:ABC-type transporter Mla maintaining outer membrane lipid asymmetry permease subunit MlaE
MYPIILTLHSILRWVVLIAAIVAVVRALVGWLGKKEWTSLDDRLSIVLSASMDLQVLLGIILYVLLSPLTRTVFQDFGAAMSDGLLRYWSVEHVFAMIVALILIHVGRATSGAAEEATKKHRRAFIFFGLATLAILIAIPWPFFSYGRPLLRLGL